MSSSFIQGGCWLVAMNLFHRQTTINYKLTIIRSCQKQGWPSTTTITKQTILLHQGHQSSGRRGFTHVLWLHKVALHPWETPHWGHKVKGAKTDSHDSKVNEEDETPVGGVCVSEGSHYRLHQHHHNVVYCHDNTHDGHGDAKLLPYHNYEWQDWRNTCSTEAEYILLISSQH